MLMRRGVDSGIAMALEAQHGTEQVKANIEHCGADAKPGKIIVAIREDWAGESSQARKVASAVSQADAAQRERAERAERRAQLKRDQAEKIKADRERFDADVLFHTFNEDALADLIREAIAGMDPKTARRVERRVASLGAREAALQRPLRAELIRVIEARRSGEPRFVPDGEQP